MTTIARSANNDIFLKGGQFAMCDGRECQGQIICAAIKTVKGELQLNTEQGIPYFDTVFENPSYLPQWADAVRKRIYQFDWVNGISSFEYSVDSENNVLNYTIVVSTDDGTITIKDIDYSIITTSSGGGGEDMQNLIQNGEFYLPVYLVNGTQVYRKLTQYVDSYGVTTELSVTRYIKNSSGTFVEYTGT